MATKSYTTDAKLRRSRVSTEKNEYNSHLKVLQNIQFDDALPSYKKTILRDSTSTKYHLTLIVFFLLGTIYLVNTHVIQPYNLINSDIKWVDKLSVNIYIESCCPDTQLFIANSLAPAYDIKGFSQLVNVSIIPWGKQTSSFNKTLNKYIYECQHGINECYGNILEACIIDLYPDYKQYVPLLIKLEDKMKEMECQNSTHCCNPTDFAKDLITEAGNIFNMDWNKIKQCTENITQRTDAETKQYELTSNLNPPLTEVPWITINGFHSNALQQNCTKSLIDCVCKEYVDKYTPNIIYSYVCGANSIIHGTSNVNSIMNCNLYLIFGIIIGIVSI